MHGAVQERTSQAMRSSIWKATISIWVGENSIKPIIRSIQKSMSSNLGREKFGKIKMEERRGK
jgi:hypothetical protein